MIFVAVSSAFRDIRIFFYEDLTKTSQHASKIGIFPISIAYWSGFGIFKQNWDNPDEIGMVGQSDGIKYYLRFKEIQSRNLTWGTNSTQTSQFHITTDLPQTLKPIQEPFQLQAPIPIQAIAILTDPLQKDSHSPNTSFSQLKDLRVKSYFFIQKYFNGEL